MLAKELTFSDVSDGLRTKKAPLQIFVDFDSISFAYFLSIELMQDSCTQTSLNKAVSPFHPVGLFFFWMLLVRGATSPGSALGVEKEESLTTLFLKERAPLAT